MEITARNLISLSPTGRRLKHDDDDNGVGQLEGFVSFGFSLHMPVNSTSTSTSSAIEDDTQDRLDALMRLFLCSREHINLVISLNATSILSVCPNDDDNRRRKIQQRLSPQDQVFQVMEGVGNQWRRTMNIFEPGLADTVLWNIPRITNEIIFFFTDNAGNAAGSDGSTRRRISVDVEYYTQWNFTYPVYQWGERDDDDILAGETSIQAQLDRSIKDGTIDAVLPWPNARASILGQEGPTFWNQATAPPVEGSSPADNTTSSAFDPTIPSDTATFLQILGAVLMLASAVVTVLLTFLARRHRLEKERLMLRSIRSGGRIGQSQRSFFHVDTEEGVSEMLLESKQYALKRQSESMATTRVRNGQKISIGQELKEEQLLLQAKREALQVLPSSSSGNTVGIPGNFRSRLLSMDDDDDDEDEDLQSDQYLDLTVSSNHNDLPVSASVEGGTHDKSAAAGATSL